MEFSVTFSKVGMDIFWDCIISYVKWNKNENFAYAAHFRAAFCILSFSIHVLTSVLLFQKA